MKICTVPWMVSVGLGMCLLAIGPGCGGDDASSATTTPNGQAGTAGSGGDAGSAGQAGSGTAGTTSAGGTAGSAGSGTAGSGTAGSGTAGSGTAGTGTAGTGGGIADPTISYACTTNGTIMAGKNEGWSIAGQDRSFYAQLPKPGTKPIAVIFLWHGFGDSADNFHNFFAPNPDADPDFPLAVITPQSTKLSPLTKPAGMDWEQLYSKNDQMNREAAMFEEILGCMNKQQQVDGTRIYSVGFSAGAIMTNLVHARYPQHVGAVVAFSGAWFNDSAEVSGVNTFGINIMLGWDPFPANSTGTVLLTHGGVNDTYGISGQKIIDFEQSAQQAVPFLTAAKRDVVDCSHSNGHQPHPDISTSMIVDFFKAHKAGETSPFNAGGLPPSFPSSCTLHKQAN
jgi:predicted esterase